MVSQLTTIAVCVILMTSYLTRGQQWSSNGKDTAVYGVMFAYNLSGKYIQNVHIAKLLHCTHRPT